MSLFRKRWVPVAVLILGAISTLLALVLIPDYRFHGRVIDQYRQPVVNAQVRYEGTHGFLSSGSGLGAVYTDEDGFFDINIYGDSLVLAAIIHPELVYAYPQKNKDVAVDRTMYAMTTDTIGFRNTDKDNRYLNAQNYQNEDNPYVINAWRLGRYEGAITGYFNGYLPADGSTHTLRFSNKFGAKQNLKGIVDGHLRINCTRKSMDSENDYGDWSVTILPVNIGGIQETEDLYLNMAPETGYLPSMTIDKRMGSNGYSPSLLNKRYYFTSNKGLVYGSLYIHFKPHTRWRDSIPLCNIKITWKLNTSGSRNLELENEKMSSPVLHGKAD